MKGSEGLDLALQEIHKLYKSGYSSIDMISTIFKVVKNYDQSMIEYLKLEYIKEIGFVHMRILSGVNSMLQLSGLVARLCAVADKVKANK